TFDLRQHRRAGYSLYPSNYGGGISLIQMHWLTEQLARSDLAGDQDIIVLAHHDPRGGVDGKDRGFYLPSVEDDGILRSACRFLETRPRIEKACAVLFGGSLFSNRSETSPPRRYGPGGFQEWMQPDPEFDCLPAFKRRSGACDFPEDRMPENRQYHSA